MTTQTKYMFKNYNHIGFNNPYYFEENGKFAIHKNFQDVLGSFNHHRSIDAVAVIELLNKNYMLADRTIIQGIYKTPWHAKPNDQLNKWIYAKTPEHGKQEIPEEEIAQTLFNKICDEIELYVGTKTKIGVLLSGGMDSRMVAGALDYLIKSGRLHNVKITGLTWGNEGTRDVVYAKEISRRLNWKWKHYTVTTEDLLNNIKEAAKYGCEYSPVHLHAIPQIRDDNSGMEVILAGSYGGSVGRAEYSGKKVKYIKPLIQKIKNVGNFVPKAVYKESLKHIQGDVNRYHQKFPKEEKYMQNELDYQLHYMRRMLNPCMDLLTEKMEFYQVFTHPNVFGYMWSISPEKRTDLVYKNMLGLFMTKLDDIPWARTGLPFGKKEGIPDSYLKNHHTYPQQIQKLLFEKTQISEHLDRLKPLGVINVNAIKIWITLLKKYPTNNLIYLEKLLWIISLSDMCELYNIKSKSKKRYQTNILLPILIPFEYFKDNLIHNTKLYIKRILGI